GQVLGLAGMEADAECDACPVVLGGPVQPSSGWVLGRELEGPDGAELSHLTDRVRITRSKRGFEVVGRELGGGPGEGGAEWGIVGGGPGRWSGRWGRGGGCRCRLMSRWCLMWR